METLSGKSVVQVGTSCIGKLGLVDPSFHFVMFRSIKNWSCKTNAQLFSGPTEYRFVNLSQVHTRRHTQWIQNNIHRTSVFQERSEKRRVGKGCGRTFRSRWSPV